jgi:hypothetical protein
LRGFRHFTRAALLALVTSVAAWVVAPGASGQVPPPTNVSPPSIVGTPQEGITLSEVPGTWTAQGGYSASVQWEDCTDNTATTCTPIQGAPTTPGSSYTLGPGDVGSFIVVVETAVDNLDTNQRASKSSAPVGVVTTTSTTAFVVSPQPAVTNQTETLVASVTSGAGSVRPSGTLAFLNGGAPISGCDHVPVSPTGQTVTIICQTTFGASVAQLSAVFAPSTGSAVAGSASAVYALSVGLDSTVTSLFVPRAIVAGEPTTFIAQVSPPAVRPGPLEPTGTVEFLDDGKPIARCLAQPIGPTGATCTITYLSTGRRAITARYQGDGNFDPSASPPQAASVRARARITSTMRWTFFFTPTYTRVLALLVQGAAHTRVLVTCHAKGCPFIRRVREVNRHTVCTRRVHGHCRQTRTSGGTLDLAPAFGSRRLAVGTRIAVAITRPGWVGKYYGFTIRPGRRPRIQISCLPPGATRPGKGC